MANWKILIFVTIFATSCGYSDDSELKNKDGQSKSSDGNQALLAGVELADLALKMVDAGAKELKKNENAAYYEQNDSHLLLALLGVRAVFGDYGLPSYDEKPRCAESGQCSSELQYTESGWTAFFTDLFRGMDTLGVSYRNGNKVDATRVVEFALNGR